LIAERTTPLVKWKHCPTLLEVFWVIAVILPDLQASLLEPFEMNVSRFLPTTLARLRAIH
jgi:hypothetical protein